jgi:hypothetical protein
MSPRSLMLQICSCNIKLNNKTLPAHFLIPKIDYTDYRQTKGMPIHEHRTSM